MTTPNTALFDDMDEGPFDPTPVNDNNARGVHRSAAPSAGRAKLAQQTGRSIAAYQESNAAEWAWIEANAAAGNEFAKSLKSALHRYGYLTPNQFTAVQRAVVRDAQPKPEAVAVEGQGLDKLVEMFARALGAGLKRPKVYIDDMDFAPAKPNGRNPGAIYVCVNGSYSGKIQHGRFTPTREAQEGLAERVAEIATDPLASAIAHGKQTGRCACCGRELTDKDSVARGIGPICFERYFGP